MAADVASVDWYQEDSASPLTMNKPAASAVGDVLVAIVIQHNNPSAQTDLTDPSGWTAQSAFDGVLDDGKAWTRVIDGSEPSTWNWPYKSTADVVGAIVRITGADPTPVIVSASTPTTSVTSPIDSPSVTPSSTNDLLLSILADICNGTQLVATVPSGMTSWGLGEVTGHFMSARLASVQLVSGAATGVKTWTSVSPTGITGGTWTIAIKSAATGATGAASVAGAGTLTSAVTQGATAAPAGAGALTAAATQIIRATASLAGAGALAANAVQRAGASPAAAGTLTALAVQGATSSPAGAGQLTANPGGTVTGTASLAGAGTLAAAARQGAAVTAAGAGALTAAGTVRVPGTATLAGAGSFAATVRQGAALATVGTGLVSAGAQVLVVATAALAGAGQLVAVGSGAVCDCLVHRPNTGTVTRGSTGTVTRPNTGIVSRPCSC